VFNAGQVAGGITSLATGLGTPANFAQGLGWAQKAAIAYDVATTGYGAYDATKRIKQGCGSALDALNFLPAVGYGASRLKGAAHGLDDAGRGLENINSRMFQTDLTRGDTSASDQLLDAMRQKGKDIVIAQPGSDDAKLLDYFGANASVNTNNIDHILVRPDVRKIEALEEFLHGTQQKLGIIDKLGDHNAEIHVKDFMIRHQKILGLSNNDVKALTKMKNSYINRAQK
jgi:hypothetical protein